MTATTDALSRENQTVSTDLPLPPETLRHRVHGASDPESFLRVGQQCANDIITALRQEGQNLHSFENTLDFGCGCGRVLRWLAPQLPSTQLFGTDIDSEAIAWCNENLPGISFGVSNSLPPLNYESNTFALVYAISVFSHLGEDYQFSWLNELRRITKPNGIVLLSIHGSYYEHELSTDSVEYLQKYGLLFNQVNGWQNIFPDWYQVTFHSKDYILKTYQRYFNIIQYIPTGMNGIQDLIVLQKRPSEDFILDRDIDIHTEVIKLQSQIHSLEALINTKNNHILYLEKLLHDIESGRIMKMLGRLQHK